ncbi:MAG: hypothetical protein U9O96_01780 [Candidatus Thermoplasmatota archaeon]|nr:hypothetical protein [Candidatus Thermoplasmatota archaeon]
MELVILLLAFIAFYVFSPDIVSLMKSAECAIDIKPAKALFMFLAYVFGLFANITASIIMYLIGGGIIILNGRRG